MTWHLLFVAVVDTSQKRLQSQMHSLLRSANDVGLTVSVSKCAVLITGMPDWGARFKVVATCPMSGSSVVGHVDDQDNKHFIADGSLHA
jgi:hypothetical protein